MGTDILPFPGACEVVSDYKRLGSAGLGGLGGLCGLACPGRARVLGLGVLGWGWGAGWVVGWGGMDHSIIKKSFKRGKKPI